MDMKLLEGFNAIDGDLCTPQGFILDTFEYQFNGLVNDISILVADNPCIVAFKCFSNAGNNVYNFKHLQDTRGIAQAVVIDAPKNFWDFAQDVSHQLGLYNENFLLAFGSNGFISNRSEFAIQLDICGVTCYFGISRFSDCVYITSDVAITYDMLSLALNDINYSLIDSSMVCIVTSGQAGNMAITKDNYLFNVFKEALQCIIDNIY